MPELSGYETPIAGVRVVPLRRIRDERGTIFHMLRRDDPHFIDFGEIYFTSIYRDVIKGCHQHTDMTLNNACPRVVGSWFYTTIAMRRQRAAP